jgi:hypothetical protein
LELPVDLIQIKDVRIELASHPFQHLLVFRMFGIPDRFQEELVASFRSRRTASKLGHEEVREDKLVEALVGFQGLILTRVSETLNSFLRPLKNNDFKEDTERKNRVLRHC